MGEPTLRAFIEVPRGTRNKYEYDEETGTVELDRRLFSAVSYPTDYGFIEETRTEEGDPMDALVCVSEPTFPGCRIAVRPIGLFCMSDENGPDNKVICVPLRDPAWSDVDEVDQLPGQLKDEIAHFFSVYTDLEDQPIEIHGWSSTDDAIAEVEKTRERYLGDDGSGG